MNAFNRTFVALLALGWVAALGAAIWLVWDQSRLIEISSSSVNLNFDLIADTEAERILATIVATALMLPALFLLLFEMKPVRHRDVALETASEGDVRKMQARISSLEKDLAEERAKGEHGRIRDADGAASKSGNRRWHLFPRH